MNFLESTETEIGYYILSEKKEPMYYKDLVMEIIEKKKKPVQSLSHTISEVYTMINMDSRFQHTGKSMWGLTEWNPPEPKRGNSVSSSASSLQVKANRRRENLLEGIQE